MDVHNFDYRLASLGWNERMLETAVKPYRRFLRFSVRALLLFVLLAGVALAWGIYEARKQGIAVRALEKVGCEVDCGPRRLNQPMTPIEQLRHLIGEENPWNGTEMWANIRTKKRQLADADLIHLRALPDLKVLHLAKTQVTDVGLANLRGLTQLEIIDLSDDAVTDASLGNLAGLKNVVTVGIGGTGVTDAGLMQLRGLSNISGLNLNRTAVTDAGLAHIEPLTRLEALNLNSTQITDAGLVYLKGMTRLVYLDLGRTRITDAGLVHLKRLPLRDLILSETQVTAAGKRELRKTLGRKCMIAR